MQEQNFEKQVQQKMEELSFVPSDPVWIKVEEKLKNKRERRQLLLWLAPLVLLCSGLLLWMNLPGDKKEATVVVEEVNKEQQEKNPVSIQQANPQENKTPSHNEQENNKEEKEQKKETINSSSSTVAPMKKESKAGNEIDVPVTKGKAAMPSFPASSSSNSLVKNPTADEKSIKTEPITATDINNSKEQASVIAENNTTASKDSSVQSSVAVKADDVQEKVKQVDSAVAKAETVTALPQTTDSVQTIAATKPNKNKWRFGFVSGAGASGVSGGVLSFSNTSQLEKSLTNNLTNASPIQQSFSAAVYMPPPSAAVSNFSFFAGADARRLLKRGLWLKVGLQYNFLSTESYVGEPVRNNNVIPFNARLMDLAVLYQNSSAYNAGGRLTKYQNSYHLIELPVGIEYQAFKKLPLKLYSGLSFGYLAGTNALHYNAKTGVYYKDKTAFDKTQLFAFTNVTYRLLTMKKAALYAGPRIQFGINNLLQDNASGKQHFYFGGFTTGISF